jgi:hypothetical protein
MFNNVFFGGVKYPLQLNITCYYAHNAYLFLCGFVTMVITSHLPHSLIFSLEFFLALKPLRNNGVEGNMLFHDVERMGCKCCLVNMVHGTSCNKITKNAIENNGK